MSLESKTNNQIQPPPNKKRRLQLTSNPSKCSIYLSKKQRYCSHDKVKNTEFCRFHLPSHQPQHNDHRFECQYCKTWIHFKQNKEWHYNRCPAKIKLDSVQNQSFYEHNIHYFGDANKATIDNHADDDTKDHTDDHEKQSFICKLKQMNESMQWTEIEDKSANNNSMPKIREIYFQTHANKQNLKHCQQIEAIIFNMLRHFNHSLDSNHKRKSIILEMGAGKAAFGSLLHCYFEEESNLIIVDIHSNFRHKQENHLTNAHNVCRIECGLQHCNLSKLMQSQQKNVDSETNLFVISKHLCGSATDFALRCVLNDVLVQKHMQKKKPIMICIALCCRGKCQWESYCNCEYLQNIDGFQGIGRREFEWIRRMATWEIDAKHAKHSKSQKNEKNEHYELGVICRRLLDEGRVQFLRRNGFENVKLIKYATKEVTKENVLLLAYQNCS